MFKESRYYGEFSREMKVLKLKTVRGRELMLANIGRGPAIYILVYLLLENHTRRGPFLQELTV